MIHWLVLRYHFLAENWKAINIHCQIYFLLFYIREKQCQGTDFSKNYAACQWESRIQYPSCLCSYRCLSAWPVPCSTHWHFWETSLKSRKKQKKKIKCSQLLFFSFEGWAPLYTNSKMGKGKKELPELVLESSSVSKETKGSQLSLPTIFSLLYSFLRSLAPWTYSRWAGVTSYWRKTNFHSIFCFLLCMSIFQSIVFPAALEHLQGQEQPGGWPVPCGWQVKAHANNFVSLKCMFCKVYF